MKNDSTLIISCLCVMAATMAFGQEHISIAAREMERARRDGKHVQKPGKCGTAFAVAATASDRPMTAKTMGVERPVLQTQVFSPSGKFVIHYDTTGTNRPALLDGNGVPIPGTHRAYAESAAVAFDRAWSAEIDGLGYASPPSDVLDGGSSAYDVYVIHQAAGMFGETIRDNTPVSTTPNEKSVTWVLIDNDFAGLRTPGIAGLQVTAAHEFFHAIQVGSYGLWTETEFYWYELTAAWMEDVVFGEVNDYVYDVRDFFTSFRTTGFTALNSFWPGYERSVFAHFLSRRFDTSVIKRIWEYIGSQRTIPALRSALAERGVTLEQALGEFAVWNFFTGDRADTVRYYAEGHLYPRQTPLTMATAMGATTTLSYLFSPLSQGHLVFATAGDTLVGILARTDEASGEQQGSIVLSMNDPRLPRQEIVGGWQLGLRAEDPRAWEVEYFSAATRRPTLRTHPRVSPNPWVLSSSRDLVLPVAGEIEDRVSVWLVSAAFEVVNVGEFTPSFVHGALAVRVPAARVAGKIASGTYAVVVRCAGKENFWKLAVVR